MVTMPINSDYKNHPNNYLLSHIPGTKGPPLIGNALPFIKDMLADSRSRVERFGEVSRFVIADQTGLLVVGADNYRTIMLDRESNFSAEMGYAQQLGAFYRGGLLLLDFDEHRMQRRIMQQAFKFTTMKHYMDPLNERFHHHLENWPTNTDIKFYYEIKKVLLDIGSKIFLGEKEFNPESEIVNQAFAAVSGGLGSVLRFNVIGTKFYRGLKGKA
ncbi:MAG TPA: cytochrome P450, partial [Porticoccaceae bacterium]|nr:cytochrome P450 [Porticoccaceae bacterium]